MGAAALAEADLPKGSRVVGSPRDSGIWGIPGLEPVEEEGGLSAVGAGAGTEMPVPVAVGGAGGMSESVIPESTEFAHCSYDNNYYNKQCHAFPFLISFSRGKTHLQ